MQMSLRARLLAGLVALAAVGLIVFGVVTYAEQRSFLLKRVDQQVAAAVSAVSFQLDRQGANAPATPGEGGSQTSTPNRPPSDQAGPRGGFGGPPPPNVSLPPGTYGQRRDARGHVVGNVVLSYGQRSPSAPKLPSKIPLSRSTQDVKPITVDSVGKSGPRYRVIAVLTGDQPGTTIVAIPLHEVDQTLHRLLVVEVLVALGVLLALAALAWWIVRVGLRPLDRMGATADAIAAGDLSRRVTPATTRTEVGRLGLALNGMLGQIEKAFAARRASEERLRRFLADASHELRTPLASIRGYAELFRIGAASGTADSKKAIRRIEDEAARMGVLVEDLLTLARLDEVREPIRDSVDLSRVAGDAADDARVIAPARAIELDAQGQVYVLGDRDQLRQVVDNLIRNALVHTPAGTAIDLKIGVEGEEAVLEVRDHGKGLPTEDGETLFERFWRADPARRRGRAGAGLGLAIVAAIVEAHGGTVSATNAPGGGASFAVRLPIRARARSSHDPAAARA